MSTGLTEDAPATAGMLALYLRSFLFTSGLWISTVVLTPLIIFLFPLPFRLRYRYALLWTRINLWWLEKTCRLGFDVAGAENIPDTPSIVMSKHQSAWETLSLQTLFSPQVWVLKRELLWIPFFGWGLAMMRPIAIDRSSGRRAVEQVVEQGKRRLAEEIWVVVFPEGTRVAPGHRIRYRLGGAVLAEQSGYPIVPVAHNAGQYWPRRSFLKRPGTIRVVIGPPIPSKSRSAHEIIRDVEDWIEDTVARISR